MKDRDGAHVAGNPRLVGRPALGEVRPPGARTYAPRMRDIDVIDSELRLLAAVRRNARVMSGRAPSTALIHQLLDERVAAVGS